MLQPPTAARALACAFWIFALAACGGHGARNLGGTLNGLNAGNSVTLKNNNDGDTITLTANGAFDFPSFVGADTPYTVVVVAQPAGQTCTVTNGTGMMDGSADTVNNIQVNCTTP